MQGRHPLPERVIEKFAKNGGELCKDVVLLSEYDELHPQSSYSSLPQISPAS